MSLDPKISHLISKISYLNPQKFYVNQGMWDMASLTLLTMLGYVGCMSGHNGY